MCPALPAAAQDPLAPLSAPLPQGALPDATFNVGFQKYTPPATPLSPYDSWDAHMALDLTVSRVGRHAVTFTSIFQTVGTENLRAKVSVGGTGYVIRASYIRTVSDTFQWAAGVSHLSSHLTRDLDEKTREQRAAGVAIPDVLDPDEYNAVFIRAHKHFPNRRFSPEVGVVIQPYNFRFNGSDAAYLRPLFVSTRWRLWARGRTRLTAETSHELGRRSWTEMKVVLGLYARSEDDARFELYLSGCPGSGLRTSPNVGSVRDGIAAGVRLAFRSATP